MTRPIGINLVFVEIIRFCQLYKAIYVNIINQIYLLNVFVKYIAYEAAGWTTERLFEIESAVKPPARQIRRDYVPK